MKVERKSFLAKLECLNPAVAISDSVPIFLNIWFDGNRAYAYDGGLGITIPIETDFKVGVSGKIILGLLASTQAEQVELVLNDVFGLDVKIGKSRSTVGTQPYTNNTWSFPIKPEGVSIDLTEPLLVALKRVLLVKPVVQDRVEHYGVTVFRDDAGCRLVTTNSHTVAQMQVESEFPDKLVLPRTFVEQITEQLTGIPAKLFILSDCFAAIGDNGTQIYSNLLGNETIEDTPGRGLRGMVARITNDSRAGFTLPEGVGEALARAELLSGSEKGPLIDLALVGGELVISGKYKLGEVREAFELAPAPDAETEITVELDQVRLKEAKSFAILAKALVLFGDGGFTCLIAGRTGKQ